MIIKLVCCLFFILTIHYVKIMSYKVEVVDSVKSVILGEGPHWDIPSQTLYFIDIMGGSVHRYTPRTNEYHSAIVGDGKVPVTMIIPVEGERNKFVISLKNDLALIEWDGKSNKTSEPIIIAHVEGQNSHRINDGKADAKGRIWAGTMDNEPNSKGEFPPVGGFYLIDNCKKNISGKSNCTSVTQIFKDIHISNGLTWTADNKKMYYIDSCRYRIDSYDYDDVTGKLTNEKTVFDFKEKNVKGLPDGMTIDNIGRLYVAGHEAGQVLRIDPETEEFIEISIPAKQVTSMAFGGKDLDELYVTSANINPKTRLPEAEDGVNGRVYKITNLDATGLPMFSVKMN